MRFGSIDVFCGARSIMLPSECHAYRLGWCSEELQYPCFCLATIVSRVTFLIGLILMQEFDGRMNAESRSHVDRDKAYELASSFGDVLGFSTRKS